MVNPTWRGNSVTPPRPTWEELADTKHRLGQLAYADTDGYRLTHQVIDHLLWARDTLTGAEHDAATPTGGTATVGSGSGHASPVEGCVHWPDIPDGTPPAIRDEMIRKYGRVNDPI